MHFHSEAPFHAVIRGHDVVPVGKQAVHDGVIQSLAPSPTHQEWLLAMGSMALSPDAVGVMTDLAARWIVWMAEVETVETLTPMRARQWGRWAASGVPLYVLVPVGFRDVAALLAWDAGVPVAEIVTYWMCNQTLWFSCHDGTHCDSATLQRRLWSRRDDRIEWDGRDGCLHAAPLPLDAARDHAFPDA